MPEPRHMAALFVSGELMQTMFFTAGRPDLWFQVQEGIPEDAKFIRWFIEDHTNRLGLVYEHESFPKCYEGTMPASLDRPLLRSCLVTMEEVEEAHRRRGKAAPHIVQG